MRGSVGGACVFPAVLTTRHNKARTGCSKNEFCGPQGCPSRHWCDPCSLLLFAGYEETLMRLAAILAKHFADSRIVGTGKDLLWGDNGASLASPAASGPADFCCDLSAESVECFMPPHTKRGWALPLSGMSC